MAFIPPKIHDTGKAYPGAGEGFQAKSNQPKGPHTGSSAGFGPMPHLGKLDNKSNQSEPLSPPTKTVRRTTGKISGPIIGHGKRK